MSVTAKNVTCLDPTEDPRWDEWVGQQEQGTFFHTSFWARVLKDSYEHRPFYLLGGEACGLPLCEIDSKLTGRRGVSLPFTDECRPLASDTSAAKAMIDAAINLGRERKWRYFLSHGSGELYEEARTGATSFFSHLVDLRKPIEVLFKECREATRRGIRKARNAGLSVEAQTTREALRSYYDLHCVTRGRHGLPPQPWSFFEQIHRHILASNLGFVVLARNKGKPVAGGVYFHFKDRAIYKYGASDFAFQESRPNNLVMWTAIERLVHNGCSELSLGRTSAANEGLRRFKLGWNALERPLWYLKYCYRRQAFVAEKDQAYGWHNKVFQRLPPVISRCIGAFLYRHWMWVALGIHPA